MEAELVEATTSGSSSSIEAGGLGDDLNLLSNIESNSANCSIVLDDMDLTMVCPNDFTVLGSLPELEDVAVEIILEEVSEGRVVVVVGAAVDTITLGAVVIPRA